MYVITLQHALLTRNEHSVDIAQCQKSLIFMTEQVAIS